MDTVNKFGNTGETEDIEYITPYHSHATNLDDLENVEGFNEDGGKDLLYGFKLNERGMYERSQINSSQGFMFDPSTVEPKTLLNIVYQNNNWKLIKTKHDWDINIKIKNNTVSCQGDSLQILRIYNSGKMLGNLVPLDDYRENLILKRHHGEYFIGAKMAQTKMLTTCEFKTKFPQDKEILENPPEGSTFLIKGYLLKNMETKESILEHLKMSVVGLSGGKAFWIKVVKNRDDFTVQSFPSEVNLSIDGEINLNKIKIYVDKYMINRIAFSKGPISNDEIFYL